MLQAPLKFAPARLVLGALAVGLSTLAWGQQQQGEPAFSMGASPVFEQMDVNRAECTPVRVRITNREGSTTGTLHVTAGNFSMDYPVSLPAQKTIGLTVYPVPGRAGAGAVTLELETQRDSQAAFATVRSQPGANWNSPPSFFVALIGGRFNDLQFIHNSRWGFGGAPGDVYAEPEEAPDRSVGYSGLKVVVLGQGAERMSDASVDALKAWALAGGTLLFTGGERSVGATDPRWANVLPLQLKRQVVVKRWEAGGDARGYPVEDVPALMGTPASPNVTGDAAGIVTERPFGLGRAVYLAFDPFSDPLVEWPARGAFFADILSPAILANSDLVLGSQGGPMQIRTALEGAPSAGNPFRAQLPATGEVATILALYFLAVVPLNFLVLRKLKRGELAWATAPILSLGFAGIFFGSAKGLYMAKLSTASKALMVLQAGNPEGVVLGRTQMYIPRAGVYDMKIDGLETISEGEGLYGDYQSYTALKGVDSGVVKPTLSVPNLAFREINFRQRVASNDWFEVRRLGDGKFEVANNSPYTLDQATLCSQGGTIPLGSLKPGESKSVNWTVGSFTSGDQAARFARMLMRSNGIGLSGTLAGYRAGPQIGEEIPGSEGTTVLFLSNEAVKAADVNAAQSQTAVVR